MTKVTCSVVFAFALGSCTLVRPATTPSSVMAADAVTTTTTAVSSTTTTSQPFTEGPNCDMARDKTVDFIAFSPCDPAPGADYSWSLAMVRIPADGLGWMSVPVCRHHDSDLWSGIPPGNWMVSSSMCPPDLRAVATRFQRGWRLGGGDAGCDMPGPVDSPCWLTPTNPQMMAAARARHLPRGEAKIGTCRVGKDGRLRLENCKWKPQP